jgi:DNA-binding GntR family transcriptional regulator
LTGALTFPAPPTLIKHSTAESLRREILEGRLKPGQRIVEGKWASQLNVAQGSVREAINLLMTEGFVEKASGRSARVLNLMEADIVQIYQLRAAIEGLAARIVTESGVDISDLDDTVSAMRAAVESGDIRQVLGHDLEFHLLLCNKTGNRFLEEHARKLLVPLFAFVSIRVFSNPTSVEAWKGTLKEHEQILQVIRLGDPFMSEQCVVRSMNRFAAAGRSVWVNTSDSAAQRR